jgi:hypothetical protein
VQGEGGLNLSLSLSLIKSSLQSPCAQGKIFTHTLKLLRMIINLLLYFFDKLCGVLLEDKLCCMT